MKLLSRSEARYAGLLILLLALAAVACVETLSFAENRIQILDQKRARDRLSDYLSFEQERMMVVLDHMLSARPPLDAPQQAFLQNVLDAGRAGQINLMAAAVVKPDGTLLDVLLSDSFRARADDEGRSLLDWKVFSDSVSSVHATSAGFIGSALGPAFVAFSPIPAEDGQTLLVLLRALDRDYIRRIQQTYPAFEGLSLPQEPTGSRQHVPVRDPAGEIIGYFIISQEYSLAREVINGISVPLYVLMMSFLFLSGGLGLWAIRFSAVIEGRRSVGRFVDAMDYMPDGILLVDRGTRTEGINPAAIEMSAGLARKGIPLAEIFPDLTAEDINTLMVTTGPHEVEKKFVRSGMQKIFRFRSQPMEGMALIMISDITSRMAHERRQRQMASLHMIGRIARGVAHDFNNILCAVSGHAELLRALKPGAEELESVEAIIGESDRGARLAGHMLELSRAGEGGQPSENIGQIIQQAGELLKVGLSAGWTVSIECDEKFSAVTLSPVQLEQVAVNLGLLVADDFDGEGVLHVMLKHPSPECLLKVPPNCAALLMVWAAPANAPALKMDAELAEAPANQYGGVIHSVVRSMLEEVDGRLDTMLDGRRFVYRVCLPGCSVHETARLHDAAAPDAAQPPAPSFSFIRGRQVMLACEPNANIADFQALLMEQGAEIKVAGSLVEALDLVNARTPLHLIVYSMGLLGEDARGLLRATLKLQPHAAILALCAVEEEAIGSMSDRIEFANADCSAQELLEAISRAWEKARHEAESVRR
ncbi:MAG: histidine kinase dimerization/phospho-acceptor domain-containing protein [Kiritimatiellia bacterium]